MFTQGFEKTASVGELLRAGTRAVVKAKDFVTSGKRVGKVVTGPPSKVSKFVSEKAKKTRAALSEYGKEVSRGMDEGKGLSKLRAAQSERLRSRDVGKSLTRRQNRILAKKDNKDKPINLKHAPEYKGRYTLSKKESLQELPKQNKQRVIERAKRLKQYTRDRSKGDKPSFMSKHPLLTLGGGMLLGKHLMGGNKAPEQPPQMMYPQY